MKKSDIACAEDTVEPLMDGKNVLNAETLGGVKGWRERKTLKH